jgi:hypothetical protein
MHIILSHTTQTHTRSQRSSRSLHPCTPCSAAATRHSCCCTSLAPSSRAARPSHGRSSPRPRYSPVSRCSCATACTNSRRSSATCCSPDPAHWARAVRAFLSFPLYPPVDLLCRRYLCHAHLPHLRQPPRKVRGHPGILVHPTQFPVRHLSESGNSGLCYVCRVTTVKLTLSVGTEDRHCRACRRRTCRLVVLEMEDISSDDPTTTMRDVAIQCLLTYTMIIEHAITLVNTGLRVYTSRLRSTTQHNTTTPYSTC